jgi:protein NrfC
MDKIKAAYLPHDMAFPMRYVLDAALVKSAEAQKVKEACPYDARYFNEEKHAIDKCNFCYDTRLSKGEKLTACAAACPAGVRIFGDLSDPSSEVYRLVHQIEHPVWVLRPEVGAKPNVFYMKF